MPINKSCARTIDILELLSHALEPLTLSQICAELNLPKSSTYEILNTLLKKEVIEYANEQLKSFRLSMKMFRIGSRVLSQTDLYTTARPALVQLSKIVGETVFLVVENQGMITYLDKVESNQPIRSTCDIGSTNYMHVTGLGKALLATYPENRVRKIVGSDPLKTYTPQSISTVDQLIRELEAIRKRGYAIDDRESMEYVRCVAAPVYDHTGEAVAAISIAVLYSCMTEEYRQSLCVQLIKTALDISHRMGYPHNQLYKTSIKECPGQ